MTKRTLLTKTIISLALSSAGIIWLGVIDFKILVAVLLIFTGNNLQQEIKNYVRPE